MQRIYTNDAVRERAATTLRRQGYAVTLFNVTDGAGTVYGIEYQPRAKK